jgi:uncharacterized protein (TIGR00369 family)
MPTLNPAYLEALYKSVNASPFPRHLPMRIMSVELSSSRIELDIAECHMQPFGIVHGGVIATLIDTATFWAAFGAIPEGAGLVNIDLKLNYLQSVTKGRLVAVGQSIRAGRTISYTEANVRSDDGTLIAHGTSTLMILPGKGLSVGLPKYLNG